MEYIRVKIRSGTTDGEKVKLARVYSIESSCTSLSTFELPKLMHALSISTNLLIREPVIDKGFPYTFPFVFGGDPVTKKGFPYSFPFTFGGESATKKEFPYSLPFVLQ